MKKRISALMLPRLLLCTLSVCPILASAQERPNILWLVSEDNDPLLGCFGDTLAKTPNIDRLAKEGIVFERCFAQPVCAPSRFTLITGMYAASSGPAQHMRALGKIPDWLTGFPSLLRSAGYYVTNNAKTDYNSPIDPKLTWHESSRNAHYRNRPAPDQPFFSIFNHEVCHESCLFPTDPPKSHLAPTNPADVRIPPYQPDTPEIRADWARYYDCIALMDKQIGAKLDDLQKAGLSDNTIIFYYSDNGGTLPRSKRFLQKSGTHVPLVVFFPPKWRHLAPASPGSRITDPVCFADFAPTLLSLTGIPKPNHMQGRAFAGPNIEPAPKYVFCTRDRMDERYDMMRSVMDLRWLYIRNFRPDLPYVQPLAYMFKARGYQSWAKLASEGKLTPQTAMFWGSKPTDELYDMEADPDCIHNLANHSDQSERTLQMRAALREHSIQIVDNGFLPEGSQNEGYEPSRIPGAFPIDRAFDAACLASDQKPEHLEKLATLLEDPSDAIRWWAAQGIGMLGTQARSAEKALIGRLKDDSEAVQVAAAEALCRIGSPKAALDLLGGFVKRTEIKPARLQALNVIERIGKEALPLLPLLQAASEDADSGASPGSKTDERDSHGRLDARERLYHTDMISRITGLLTGKIEPLVYPKNQ